MNHDSEPDIFVTAPSLAPLAEVTRLLEGVWARGILTHNGPLVRELEARLAERLGLRRLVVVANGTLAIQMAIRALDLRGEIITTPFSFIATLNSILWEHCTPVFADIDPDTFQLDPARVEQAITPRTVAVMPVHVFGAACDIDAFAEIAERRRLRVIYDAAHAVGVNFRGRSIFEYGDISATSFHATKLFNTGEGGGCITTDEALDARLRQIRFFGFDDRKEVVTNGFNGKMTEIHAALGLANLSVLDRAAAERKRQYFLYRERLDGVPGLRFQQISDACNYSYFPLVFDTPEALERADAALLEHKIHPRRYFTPSLNTLSALVAYTPMPVSESLSGRILCLPHYLGLPDETIETICRTIRRSRQC